MREKAIGYFIVLFMVHADNVHLAYSDLRLQKLLDTVHSFRELIDLAVNMTDQSNGCIHCQI